MLEKDTGCHNAEIYQKLLEYIKDIRYGSIVVVIQDGKIVQIEKNEKVRFI
ncbi:DUF2292 domain-containing protein [Caproiciproducens sp. NJN-50]|uniref:YezD family protein n=1 Tax=Acutalibacteraceae TaxID=3082771 RepID=UPI000FFE0B27|nr:MULTISPECIES: YezD family protein [Acutalibacteraceae]QAT51324.1 DUF2292 domain-containing protein [Caproiciproducens sp. NJN-50]